MGLLFCHDHKFRKINEKIYTTGGLSDEVLSRYVNIFGEVTVVARIIEETVTNEHYSVITNPEVKIVGRNTISKSEIEHLVHINDKIIARLPSVIGSEVIHIARKYRKRYCVEVVASAWNSYWNHGAIGKVVAIPMELITKIYVNRANFVLYVTDFYLQKMYPTKGKNINCSDVVLPFNNSMLLHDKEYFKKSNKNVVIGTIAATDVKYKGQEYVIRALGELKRRGISKFEYQIVGNGDISRLKKIAVAENVIDKVDFMGGIPHEKIFNWLKTIDIYAQPSEIEGMPRAVLEAMSCSIPCIGSKVGGIPELIPEEGLFTKKNYKEIAEILISADDMWFNIMSKHSTSRVRDFDNKILEKRRNKFYKAYKDLV